MTSFIQHRGDSGGGHYVAYAWQDENGERRWYELDDNFIRPVSPENLAIAKQNLYYVHYRRI